jgi:putative addiction module killer protein
MAERLEVQTTTEFDAWFARLRDERAAAAIRARMLRLRSGNFGDAKSVGEGVAELRVDLGPGYRVYYTRIGLVVVVLLVGGDKRSQTRDIAAAKRLADRVRGEHR